MKDIPVQYHSFRKTTMGDNIISFRVDQLYSATVSEIVSLDIGTEFIMKLEDVTSSTVLNKDSDPDATIGKEKFFRHLRARMREFQEKTGMDESEVKRELLDKLAKKNIFIESTTEMNIKQLAISIGIMEALIAE